jgi:2-(1,2-epoxy-1,2-dihydrophenyl)acetyl-CoA isomerase
METYETLLVERRGKIVIVTLHRPEDANCLNWQMATELAAVAAHCDTEPSVRAVVLTGSGRFFCAGGDVKAMARFGSDIASQMKRLADELHRTISTFSRMKAPLIVAINGPAAGAGFSLAVTGDIVIASESSDFTMAYAAVGLSPDGSSSYFLPRLIGLRRTQELMLTNRKLTASEALDWGVVTSVAPPDQLKERALQTAEYCAAGSVDSNSVVKKLLLGTFGNSLETQMEIEGRHIARCAATVNGQEGIRAFVEKCNPRFQ